MEKIKISRIVGVISVVCIVMCTVNVTYGQSSTTPIPTSVACTGQFSPLFSISFSQSTIDTIKWSPDSLKLASTNWPALDIWNTKTGDLEYQIPDAYAAGVSWSPNGAYLATTRGGDREHLLIWDAVTGKLLHDFDRSPYNDSSVVLSYHVAWSPNGKTI